MARKKITRREIRHRRVRRKISGTPERPRLCVYVSNRNLYAQLVDDTRGRTLCALSTGCKELKEATKGKPMRERAIALGEKIAEMAAGKGIQTVVFDRSGCRYGLRLKNLAAAAREKGLKF